MTHEQENTELCIATLRGLWKAIGELDEVSRENRYSARENWVENVQRDLWKEQQRLQELLDTLVEEWNADGEQRLIAECSSVNSYNEHASKECLIFTVLPPGTILQETTHGVKGFRLTQAECSKCEESRLAEAGSPGRARQ
jgi:hypothetical protein